jgi:hypothetical protein
MKAFSKSVLTERSFLTWLNQSLRAKTSRPGQSRFVQELSSTTAQTLTLLRQSRTCKRLLVRTTWDSSQLCAETLSTHWDQESHSQQTSSRHPLLTQRRSRWSSGMAKSTGLQRYTHRVATLYEHFLILLAQVSVQPRDKELDHSNSAQ